MRNLVRRLHARAHYLWDMAKRERASPAQVGVSVGLGTMSCFSPFLYLHLPLALLLSTALRVNRLWAAIASQFPSLFGLLRPLIVVAEIEAGHFARGRGWIDSHDVLEHTRALLVDWLVGWGIVGSAASVACGAAAWVYARRLATARTRDGSPRPSSESSP